MKCYFILNDKNIIVLKSIVKKYIYVYTTDINIT